MEYSHDFCVQMSDIDEHNHVNNVAYLRWIQETAIAHWEASASNAMLESFTWFVLRHEIDYKSRAFEGDQITAKTWVGTASKIKCERFTEIRRGETLLVKSKSIWCLFDSKTQKPVRISDELRRTFGMR